MASSGGVIEPIQRIGLLSNVPYDTEFNCSKKLSYQTQSNLCAVF